MLYRPRHQNSGRLHRGTGKLYRGTTKPARIRAEGRIPGVAPRGCTGTTWAAPGVVRGDWGLHRGLHRELSRAEGPHCPGHCGGGVAPESYLEPGRFVAGRGGAGLRHGRAGGGRCCLRRPLGRLRCQSRHRDPHSPRGGQHRPAPGIGPPVRPRTPPGQPPAPVRPRSLRPARTQPTAGRAASPRGCPSVRPSTTN